MKNNDFEMQRLFMADSDDYDEYEEEVIDRDEEYDADDDEEYDDEEYDDEEYDDDYDDEEYDDGYDDGYDDSYYDDRLNKVLDELAELKRTVANPPAVQNNGNQPAYVQPSIPYVYAGNIPQNMGAQGSNNGEILMYNEISRLRDELSRTQSSQNLHVELNRLKDEMERDRKYNESQYLAEIRRLNEKIETLEKNALSPQSENSGYLADTSTSEGESIDNGTLDKLISINEAILQNAKSTDTRLQSEVADIKKRLSALDTDELARSISSIKKLAKSGLSSEELTALSAQVGLLSDALTSAGISAVPAVGNDKIEIGLSELKDFVVSGHTDSLLLLEKLYELGLTVGYDNEKTAASKNTALSLIVRLIALKHNDDEASFGESLKGLSDIESELSALDVADAVTLAYACDSVAAEIMKHGLDRKSVDDLFKFVDDTALISVGKEKRENLDKFASLAQRLAKSEPKEALEQLPQLLELKSKLQDAAKQDSDAHAAKELTALISEGKEETAPKAKEMLAEICRIRACDVVKFPKAPIESHEFEYTQTGSMIEKIDKILALLSNGAPLAVASESDSEIAAADALSLEPIKEEIVKLCSVKQLDDAVADLKSQYAQILNAVASMPSVASRPAPAAASEFTDSNSEAQYSNNEISDQLYNVRDELNKAIHDENAITQDTVELKLTDITESQRRLSEDLEYIKNKLSETAEVIETVSSARNAAAESQEESDKIGEDIAEQFDKLYEDVSALLTSTENNVVDRLNETVGATMDNVNTIIDSINSNIDNINALVSGVNTSLDGVNSNFELTNNNIAGLSNTLIDSLANLTVALDEVKENINNLSAADVSALLADNVTELKIAVDDFIARSTANDDAAYNDRLRLVDDVAFLRENAENGANAEERREILNEIANMRDNITRDLGVLTDTVSALNLDEMRENVATIRDTLDILAADTSVAAMGEDIAAMRESSNSMSEVLNTSVSAQEEFRAALADDLAYIRSKLDENNISEGASEGVTIDDVYTALATVNDKLDAASSIEQQDVQTLTSYLEEIKEQLHLKELEPSIEGLTGSEEEKQALLGEIAEVRERLAGLEESSKGQNDVALEQLAAIYNEINILKETVTVASTSDADGLGAAINDLSLRIDALSQQEPQMDLLAPMADDIAQIRDVLATRESVGESDGVADIMQTVNDMSDRVKDFSERMELASLEIESIPLVLSELSEVKSSLSEIKEMLSGHSENVSDSVDTDDDISRRLDDLSEKTNEIIERSESGIDTESFREVSDEIAEIRENLISDYEKIKEDISFIRNQIEINVDMEPEESAIETSDEELGTILEELAEIKEKLAAVDEYDVMAEILSLRDDIKASRVADTTETDDLQQVKAEFAERNEIIMDEIRSLRNDLANLVGGESVSSEPTESELNLVLGEIVSLRDEIQAYKDELTASVNTAPAETEKVETGAASEEIDDSVRDNIDVILDEIIGMRSEIAGYKEENEEKQREELDPLKSGIDELHTEISELKDVISRRTSIAGDNISVTEEGISSSGLDVVLNELINLKNDFENVRAQMSEEIQSVRDAVSEDSENAVMADRLSAIEESIAGLSNRLDNVDFDENRTVEEESVSSDREDRIITAIEQLKSHNSVGDESGVVLDILSEMLLLHNEISDMRSMLEHRTANVAEQDNIIGSVDYESDDVGNVGLIDELAAIKELLQQNNAVRDEEIAMLKDEIAGLRQQLTNDGGSHENVEFGAGEEIAALREEIADLKEQLSVSRFGESGESEPDMSVMTEIMSLRDEIVSLKDQMTQQPVSEMASEPDMTVLTEIMALREEVGSLKEALGAGDTDMSETVAQIREDVRVIKDEPDLSALNEVLALRDEFQAMKEAMSSKPAHDEEAKTNDEILSEVQSLRDQLFAISMANVTDGSADKVTYESYNNIILDEITALREEVNAYKTSDAVRGVLDEIADIKRSIEAQTADESELMTQLSKLKSDLEQLKSNNERDAANNAILEELAVLKTEMANQREADLTTQNFMAELAELIERQSNDRGANMTDELVSLKEEIASSLAAPSADSNVILSEIAKLKEELSRESGKDASNQKILDELAKLKNEISEEKPSRQNRMVLDEIARLKEEIGVLAERGSESGNEVAASEISQSINDLKNELTQIAGIVSEDSAPAKKSTRKTGTSKTGAKRGRPSKSGTTAKKPAKKEVPSEISSDELLSKIDSATFEVPRGDGDYRSLDPNYVSNDDDLDLASKLAKQVANKLIMEQLVEQLGDGGVPENEVEEIVKDILPSEFTTVQIEEQSDQVRRLANSLVLDKLRTRLTGKSSDDDKK